MVHERKCSTMAIMSKPNELACACAALFLLHASSGHAAVQAGPQPAARLDHHSLERLPGIVVTPVSRQQSRLGNAPAPVHAAGGPGGVLRQLRRSHDLARGPGTDPLLRRAARLRPAVPGYHQLDARIAWQAGPGVEPALAGPRLLYPRHPGLGTAGLRQLAERDVFASALLRF